jgi:hypothetical protein
MAPAPQPFDGQFFQLDVVSVKPAADQVDVRC